MFDNENTACCCNEEKDDTAANLIADGRFELSKLKTCDKNKFEGEIDLKFEEADAGTITLGMKYYQDSKKMDTDNEQKTKKEQEDI